MRGKLTENDQIIRLKSSEGKITNEKTWEELVVKFYSVFALEDMEVLLLLASEGRGGEMPLKTTLSRKKSIDVNSLEVKRLKEWDLNKTHGPDGISPFVCVRLFKAPLNVGNVPTMEESQCNTSI